MNPANSPDRWPIYNCHIHTFTRKHTPRHFILFVLSDPKLGKINLLKSFLFLVFFLAYVTGVYVLGNYLLLASAQLDGLNMPLYAVLLLLEGLLTVPLIMLAFVVLALIVLLLFQAGVDALLDWRSRREPEMQNGKMAPPNVLVSWLAWLNPASSNDIFDRIARFLKIAAQPSQRAVFEQIRQQYQTKETKTRFVVLPMDMTFMKMGKLTKSIDDQHAELLWLSRCYKGQIIPFYGVHPCQPDIVQKVRRHVVNGPFRGIKIYPNLGYPPYHDTLMKIYELCVTNDIPVMTHCSPGGIWQYGLSETTRRDYSQPTSYVRVLEAFPRLKLCLAHFGGAQEWTRRLKRDVQNNKYPEEPWVRTIYEMIAGGEQQYPNLYTDISYTAFTPKVQGLYVDLVDYLKVLLAHPRVRTRVLFGSDYYMIEQEKISEKEASILLRSRLGEDLYKQIAYTNPREFLCIKDPEDTPIAAALLAQK